MRRLLLACFLISTFLLGYAANPKREFRGAWLHTVGQSQYSNQTTQQNKDYLCQQLDLLKEAGINVVIFQVRPSADAFYNSKLEPWSRYLTADGKAPTPYWDPLDFIIKEAHARGMELHAWLNPYRVTTTRAQKPAPGHLYYEEPYRFVRYEGDGRLYFDPGIPENSDFIAKVVTDILNRYDVDGIHFDDYFYPYPANKKDFPDAKSFAKYGKGKTKAEWRRANVDMLIEKVYNAVRKSDRPWARFGVSPFGIWRNKRSDKRGSETAGLQNYDDLYADVILWAEKGWVDYLVPQLYWELDHARASYLVLVDWWAKAVDPKCQLYIGQDVERTMKLPDIAPSKHSNQLAHKVDLTRSSIAIQGNCWWPGYSLTKNSQNSATELKKSYHNTLALPPAFPSLSTDIPNPVTNFKRDKDKLIWESPKTNSEIAKAVKYVVYRFDFNSDKDYDNASNILTITSDCSTPIKGKGIYVVTAIDHVNQESNPSKEIIVK